MIVLVEGAEFASALCHYLREFEHYLHLKADPAKQFHKYLLEWENILANNKDVVIEGSHLGSLDRGLYTADKVRLIDEVLADSDFKLVWAIGEAERFNITSSHKGTTFFQSKMDKVAFIEGRPITNLVRWINGGSGRDVRKSAQA